MHKYGLAAAIAVAAVIATVTPATAAPQRVIYTDGNIASFNWTIPAKGHVELTLKSCEDLTWRHQAVGGVIRAAHSIPADYVCSRGGNIRVVVDGSSFNAIVVHRSTPKGAF